MSGFKIISGSEVLPNNVDFFFAWIEKEYSEKELNDCIELAFPSIPSEKLISCQINLAFPVKNSNFFDISIKRGKIIPIVPMSRLLYKMELLDINNEEKVDYSDSIKVWTFLTKLLFELLNRGQFIPKMERFNSKYHKSSWKVLVKTENDRSRFDAIVNWSSWASFCLPIDFIASNGGFKSEGLWHPSYLFSLFLDEVGDSLIRTILNQKDFIAFQEYYSSEIEREANENFKPSWDYKFLTSLISKDPLYKIGGFHESILPDLIQNWTQSVRSFPFKVNFSIRLKLEYPKENQSKWSLNIFLILEDKSYPLRELWVVANILNEELKNDVNKEGSDLEFILRALGKIVKIYPPVQRAFEDELQSTIYLTNDEVINFLKFPKDLLIQSGVIVELPEVFKRGGMQRLTNKLLIRSRDIKDQNMRTYSVLPSLFDVNSLLDVKWEVKIGEKEVSKEKVDQIIKSNKPLINLDGDWVLIEQADLEELQTLQKPHIENYMDALRLGMTGKFQSAQGNEYEVVLEGDFKQIINSLVKINKFDSISVPSLFKGKLRHYQQEGLNWMGNLARFNFGLCLADDMGLGKTIQIIAFLSYLKENFPNNPGSYLIICPTSILFNWQHELNKFAPELKVTIHHGPNRIRDLTKIQEFTQSHRVFLTSYGTIRNDVEILETIQFSGIIVDESQNMKNYYSQQTQAINKLKSQFRICLSGTPIENRLMELWSLFNFLNPGLLGSRSDFQKDFIIPIDRFQDQQAIDRLKLIINPFLMRRVKSDKNIISDLPEKNEMKILIELTEDQVELYQDLVNSTLKELQKTYSDKGKNKGLILSLIVKLKQICNHPYQFIKKDINSINFEENLKQVISKSKKLKRLVEMSEEVISNGEKVLIFTQFTQMGDIIKKVLENRLKLEILYFHGGIPEQKRKSIVDKFQSSETDSPPILILSLRAGGTGLNLTQGTTVIHFDRWWNPAVENQATDRAYRIGQRSVVNVYKFISKGTIEEKIDALLEEKKDLADKIVTTTGESWITGLEGDKLKELLVLSK